MGLLGCVIVLMTPLAAHASPTTVSYVAVAGERGSPDYSGTSAEWWAPGGGKVDASGSTSSKISIGAYGGPSTLGENLDFVPPPGQSLAVGTYADARETGSAQGAHPGIGIDGHCPIAFGSFTITDIAFTPDGALGRLRMSFEGHCAYNTSGLIGEIVVNEPAPDENALAFPESMTFPPTYAGATSATRLVHLFNEQSTPLRVSTVALTGTDAAKFTIASDGCSGRSVAPGATCAVSVTFRPGADHTAATATVVFTDDSTSGTHSATLAATVEPGNTSLDMIGDVDDQVLGPIHVRGSPATGAVFTTTGTPSSVNVSYQEQSVGGHQAYFTFAAPTGQTLSAGDYSSTSESASSTAPGMVVQSYSCPNGQETGSFHIYEVGFNADTGELSALSLTFEAHCGTATAGAYGSIAWHATDPAVPSPVGPGSASDTTGPVAPIAGLALGGTGLVRLTWYNPPDADWDRTIVRGLAGLTPPATATSGTLLYSGRGTTVDVKGLVQGWSYSFTVWGIDTRGNFSKPTHMVAHGTYMVIYVPRAAPYSQTAIFRAQIVDAVTGKPQQTFARFKVRYPGSTTWKLFGFANAVETGVTAVGGIVLTHPAYVRADFYGGIGLIGSISPAVYVPLQPGLNGSFLGTLKPGGLEKIYGTVLPNLASHRIYLQRHSGGRWLAYRSMLLTSRSAFSFAFTLTAGTFTFRLYMPAIGSFKPLISETLIVVVR